MKLVDQQAELAQWVLDPSADRLPEGLTSLKDLPAAKGAALYRESILEVEIRALIITFPVVYDLVGENYFRMAATKYLRGGALQDGNLDHIGDAFPDFLPAVPGYDQTPYLADVARLELALGAANDGPDPIKLDAWALKALAQDAALVRLQLVSNGTLLESPFPVDRIHEISCCETDVTLDIAQDAEMCRLIVWRSGQNAQFKRLDCDQWVLLSAIANEPSFVLACERALGAAPKLDVGAVIGQAVSNGWIEVSA